MPMKVNEYVSASGEPAAPEGTEASAFLRDGAIPNDWAIETLSFESELEPMCFTLTAKRITLMDGGIRIELLEPQREWFFKHGISKLKINDATFTLEEKE